MGECDSVGAVHREVALSRAGVLGDDPEARRRGRPAGSPGLLILRALPTQWVPRSIEPAEMSNSEPSAIVLHCIPCIGGLYKVSIRRADDPCKTA
jgi:hypothetical protein